MEYKSSLLFLADKLFRRNIGGRPISVTFCPLTGTGLVFDATGDDGRRFQLGVSGLLFNTNVIMYDGRDDEPRRRRHAHQHTRQKQ